MPDFAIVVCLGSINQGLEAAWRRDQAQGPRCALTRHRTGILIQHGHQGIDGTTSFQSSKLESRIAASRVAPLRDLLHQTIDSGED